MENKYVALRFIAGVKIFIGWAISVIGLILGLYSLSQHDNSINKIELIFLTVASVIGGLILVAIGQLIYLFIDIENNTRKEDNYSHISKTTISPIDPKTSDDNRRFFAQEISPDFDKPLNELNQLITKEKRKLISGQNESIINLLRKTIADKEMFSLVNAEYRKRFGKDLIDHLISISTSYATIYYYVEPLVDLGICENQYPHKLIEL